MEEALLLVVRDFDGHSAISNGESISFDESTADDGDGPLWTAFGAHSGATRLQPFR